MGKAQALTGFLESAKGDYQGGNNKTNVLFRRFAFTQRRFFRKQTFRKVKGLLSFQGTCCLLFIPSSVSHCVSFRLWGCIYRKLQMLRIFSFLLKTLLKVNFQRVFNKPDTLRCCNLRCVHLVAAVGFEPTTCRV